MATVTPLPGATPAKPVAIEKPAVGSAISRPAAVAAKPRPSVPRKIEALKKTAPGTTLDGGWDRRLARGSVEPDATVDLHGQTLSSAYRMLDAALDRSRARGDRVILLITGKPPRRESERPHARGAIRAAVGDWLHASRHAEAIAAVRGASPRHGGTGALYIVLRRPRTTPKF
ncbi:DNA mismatch repair protein MutS [Sphingomonas panacisoli]|uniref:DNA mismatch repair protein MutS n=2 Tax=Sphingomonas panacisoli TaxID=1813879 RepID=A0A5B8LLW7_9SPHN|nr:DNA mismatch repair protein MutS [Sphingomonas panacisoli]